MVRLNLLLEKLKLRWNRQQKSATCFSTSLQNYLKSDPARLTTHESNLSCITSCSVLQLAKRRTKLFYYLFLFLLANKIHSADVNLRIKVVISKLKQFAIQERCFALSFSPYKIPLLDLTIESFRVFLDNLATTFTKIFSPIGQLVSKT